MQLKKLLEKWDLTSLKIKAPFLEMEWQPNNEDKTAAWELYIELITRAATQRLAPDEGDEAAALKSIYELFPLTRDTIKRNGRYCINFTRIAVVVLNQKVLPFTSKWHPRTIAGRSAITDRSHDDATKPSRRRLPMVRCTRSNPPIPSIDGSSSGKC